MRDSVASGQLESPTKSLEDCELIVLIRVITESSHLIAKVLYKTLTYFFINVNKYFQLTRIRTFCF